MPRKTDEEEVLLLYLLWRRHQQRQSAKWRRKRKYWVRPMIRKRKAHGQYHVLMKTLANDDREYFFRYMRMSPERFQHLASLVQPLLEKNCSGREPISASERLAITLRYLATGDSQQSQAFNFRVGRSTVSNIVKETCSALWEALHATYMKTPATTHEWEEIASEFQTEWNLPHVLGAIDGKHIAMECPKYGGSMYYNYKNFHSTVLMAICDAKYCFTYVSIGSYGRDNDASIFSQTDMFNALENGEISIPKPKNVDGFTLPYVFVRDDIFPLKSWLMKPYPGRNLAEPQAIFNYRLSRARRTIENAFGIMSARWRILRRPIRADVTTVDVIVKAAVILHNYMCLTDNATYIPAGFVDCSSSDGTIKEGNWRKIAGGNRGLTSIARVGAPNYTRSAKDVRDQFKGYVTSENGSVSWQLGHIRNCGAVRT